MNDSPPEGSRFDPKAGGMGKMYRARYLKDGFFQALPLIKEVAVSTSSYNFGLNPDRDAG